VNWEAISAIANVLGAIAVIVTLGYVAIQIRQNTSILKSTATQGAHDQTSELYDMLASNSELGEIFARGLEAPESLDGKETARFYSICMSATFKLQNWWFQTESGAIEGELFSSWAKILRPISALPGWSAFWQRRRFVFAPAFVAFLEESVFSMEPDPSYRVLGVEDPRD